MTDMPTILRIPRLLRVILAVVPALAVGVACAAQQPVDKVVKSADAFLTTLSDEQRARVVYNFDDSTQRARWSNFPTGFVPRGGMSLKQMNANQKAAALSLMKTVLSARGLREG